MSASHNAQGLLFVLVGPPGAGKNALMNAALTDLDNLTQLATATTRPIRPTEQQGREHNFVTSDVFREMIADNELLEWQQVHLNLYGIPRQTVETAFNNGHDLTADIDVLGATYIRSLYPDNVIMIFIKPPSVDELENRMRQRGEPEDEIATRMKRVNMEMTYAPLCDYVIVNDDFDQAAASLKRIIETHRQNPASDRQHSFLHLASAIAVHHDMVLTSDQPPYFPCVEVATGELPHRAAMRALQQLGAAPDDMTLYNNPENPHHGSFHPPAHLGITHTDETRQIIFSYVVMLSQPFDPPVGWAWRRHQMTQLQPEISDLLKAQAELSSSE